MISCLPLLVLFFLSMASVSGVLPIEQLDIEIGTNVIYNSLFLLAFAGIFGVFFYAYYDLG